jgi:hypothetical protein
LRLFSRLPSYLSARAVIVLSDSVLEILLFPCSQATKRPCLSKVSPLELPLGERNFTIPPSEIHR